MWLMTFEVVGVTFAQNGGLLANRHLQSAAQHDAAFLALMSNRMLTGAGAGLVALLQQLYGPVRKVAADLPERYSAVRNLCQLGSPKEHPVTRFELITEELTTFEYVP